MTECGEATDLDPVYIYNMWDKEGIALFSSVNKTVSEWVVNFLQLFTVCLLYTSDAADES